MSNTLILPALALFGPCHLSIRHPSRQTRQPSIQLLTHHILDITLILRSDVLFLQRRRSNVRLAIHRLL
jgi:hypothetical protein